MHSLHRNFVATVLAVALCCVPMPAFAALDTLDVTIDETVTNLQAFSDGGSVFLKASDLSDIFKAELAYDTQKKDATYTLGKTLFGKKEAVFRVDSTDATVNGKEISLHVAPILHEDTLWMPAEVLKSVWNASYGFNDEAVYIHTDGSDVVVPESQKVFVEKKSIIIDEKPMVVRYVYIPNFSALKTDIVLAQNTVSAAEELSSMATRTSAKAAINGGFFQSFDESKAQEPYGILIKDGKLIHSDNTGSTLGFTKDGAVKLDVVRSVVSIKVADTEYTVSLVNHSPAVDSNAISLFTSAYGKSIELNGTAVVVQNGVVCAVSDSKTVNIPKDGYVLLFTGNKTALTTSMKKGDTVSYAVSYVNGNNTKVDWSDVQTAIGAGPILVKDGKNVLNPAKEGFTDVTSFQIAVARSAVGITEDGTMLLVGGIKCTTEQLAEIMIQLGATNAISMDSGASSGLYSVATEAVAAPMKAINNALIIK